MRPRGIEKDKQWLLYGRRYRDRPSSLIRLGLLWLLIGLAVLLSQGCQAKGEQRQLSVRLSVPILLEIDWDERRLRTKNPTYAWEFLSRPSQKTLR